MSTLSPHIEAASTLAVIASSNEPLLYLSGDLRVIAASGTFCRAFGTNPAAVSGKLLPELGLGEWKLPQIVSLLKATASGLAAVEMYETDLVISGQPTRKLVLNAHKLNDGNSEQIRLLLAITDVTLARAEARQMEDLIREKEVLLREVQHRVANSLQIIASVLMQSARRVQSEEARGHLRDAHHRVMSIAAVQRLLAQSTLGEVNVHSYFQQLCSSLSASMISEPDRLKIVVTGDESAVAANVSVSLGLIVTELVINALKHAFSEATSGRVDVDYHSIGDGWVLTVTDDGNGMPVVEKPGLGTGIVEALSKQLQADVRISGNSPGTSVKIVHEAREMGTCLPVAA